MFPSKSILHNVLPEINNAINSGEKIAIPPQTSKWFKQELWKLALKKDKYLIALLALYGDKKTGVIHDKVVLVKLFATTCGLFIDDNYHPRLIINAEALEQKQHKVLTIEQAIELLKRKPDISLHLVNTYFKRFDDVRFYIISQQFLILGINKKRGFHSTIMYVDYRNVD